MGRDDRQQDVTALGAQREETVPSEYEEEFIDLYQSFHGPIFAYFVNRLYGRDLAEDAASEVFLLLVRKYPQLRHRDRTGIRNWLYGAARNVVSRYRRDAKRRREIAEALVLRGTSASEIPDEDTSDRVALYRKMGRLKPIDREILTLRYFDDMESPQIAEVLGLTAGAVRVRISRTVRRLRNELGETRNNG